MVNRIVNLRLGSKLLKEIDSIVKSETYESRTEFIKDALRKAVEERRREQAAQSLSKKLGLEGPSPAELESIMDSAGKKTAERKHPTGIS
ncbi:MAG: ribbon-helix-helix domain-containing protein [Candidatus Diapherotrites archaeon]|nr:ribbon-helix-helix domain-containing protein [Candidatus Diapherotrites archaeon]